MTGSDTPNKDRAEAALSIYRSEMRQYISLVLQREYGPNWMLSTMLSDDSREHSPERQVRSSSSDVTPEELIDFANIPRLIQDDRLSFDDLRRADIDRMHWIRNLRNELYHSGRAGDCTPSAADAIAGLCGLVLERCGLANAVESIHRLSSAKSESEDEPPSTALREERSQRPLAHHRQDRVATEPPRGGTADEIRAHRALLIYRAAMRQHLRSILQQEYGTDWIRQTVERETSGRVRRDVERRLRMGDASTPEELLDIGHFPLVIQETQQLFPDLQPADIGAMSSIANLRNKITHATDGTIYRVDIDKIVDLCSQVLEQCGLADTAETVRRLSSDQHSPAEPLDLLKRPLLSRIFRR